MKITVRVLDSETELYLARMVLTLASLTCASWEAVVSSRTIITLVTFNICFAATSSIGITRTIIAISSLCVTSTSYEGKNCMLFLCHVHILASLTSASWEVVVTSRTCITLVTFNIFLARAYTISGTSNCTYSTYKNIHTYILG